LSLLGVEEVINEPLFTEPATWIQRLAQIGQDGVATYPEVATPIMVIPTSGDGSTLERNRDGGLVHHRQRFYTTAPLKPGMRGSDADRVLWRGRLYQVESVGDWSGWGQGFVSAACELLPADGGVPTDPE
jgi:hypothetical protein